ncbi:uncharacterized protein LOC119679360 [Teleopsis dalmanni]|uniref:uncharacterized protein LOC119679360 n=1 Tax=Teleopsis dalmanni TaxID=139649 RepID=UPI0018CDB1FF|nr:uncharacterized protein LOC119679360 [Teleopsis dalmanni]XP_037947597.1 uncharacterized protein LOC119679360 [Teleopsis dalmanni]
MDSRIFIILVILNVQLICSDNINYVTQTVYGFLDFTTTIGDTVMVFSPQSAPSLQQLNLSDDIIKTNPLNNIEKNVENGIKPTKLKNQNKPSSAKVNVVTEIKEEVKSTPAVSEKVIAKKSSKPIENDIPSKSKVIAIQVENNQDQPEYDLLSRQPLEYAEETYRIVNPKSISRNRDRNPSAENNLKTREPTTSHPVGLITKLSGTEVKNGVTYVYDTSVIGNYVSDKYTQVLHSSSYIYKNKKPNLRPTSSLRILKTSAPQLSKSNQKAPHPNSLPSKKNRRTSSHPNKSSSKSVTESSTNADHHKSSSNTKTKTKRRHKGSRATATQKVRPVSATVVPETNNRKSFRPKIQPSSTETELPSSLFLSKLNRTPGRWQYRSKPKPTVSIRKAINENVSPSVATIESGNLISQDKIDQNVISDQGELEGLGSQNAPIINNGNELKPHAYAETLNVEISTPADFKDTYYEIATIKQPFTFQAGVVKKTRFITVTSTFEKHIEPTTQVNISATRDEPLTENILAETTKIDSNFLDGSVSTLKPLHLTENAETPSLETVTETFSVTQTKYKTQILPIVQDFSNETTLLTLVQKYDLTTLITATKTIFSHDDYQFNPSKDFKDFAGNLDEAGSEINLDLDFGDYDNVFAPNENKNKQPNNKAEDILHSPIVKPDINSLQQNSYLNFFQQTMPFSTVITTSQPYIKIETIWESHVIPIINGQSTSFRTLSKSIGTIDRTEYHLDSSTITSYPSAPTINPFILPTQQFHTLTSAIIEQTLATQVNSKTLKLTFGAKTATTTILSTIVVPTSVTKIITTSVPVQPSIPFPGYFPPPYPPFGYLG